MSKFGMRGRVGAAAWTALSLLVFAAGPVAAAAPVRELQHRTVETSGDELCDEEWLITSTTTSLLTLRAGSPSDPTPLFFSRENRTSVYTDPADSSRGFVIDSATVFHDLHVTRLEGTVYVFESADAGTSALATLAGRAVGRDRGHRTWTFIIDTNGSTNLEDYQLLDVTVGDVDGPHPTDEAFCDLVAQAVAG